MSDDAAVERLGGWTLWGSSMMALVEPSNRRTAEPLPCNRCGFPVRPIPWGCKNPCGNCGTIYPHGDCSD